MGTESLRPYLTSSMPLNCVNPIQAKEPTAHFLPDLSRPTVPEGMMPDLCNETLQNHKDAACDDDPSIAKSPQKDQTDDITPSFKPRIPMDFERPEKGNV